MKIVGWIVTTSHESGNTHEFETMSDLDGLNLYVQLENVCVSARASKLAMSVELKDSDWYFRAVLA